MQGYHVSHNIMSAQTLNRRELWHYFMLIAYMPPQLHPNWSLSLETKCTMTII